MVQEPITLGKMLFSLACVTWRTTWVSCHTIVLNLLGETNAYTAAVAQEAWNNKTQTTLNGYLTWTKRNSLEPSTTELQSGLNLCWVGPKDADKILLYFHGGGYVSGASPGHIKWAADLQKTCSKDTTFSIVFVAYSLANPTSGRYPLHLQEAAEALHWMLETHGKKPGDIIIGGVSQDKIPSWTCVDEWML